MTRAGRAGSVPTPSTALIGRDEDLAHVLELLDASSLVTLTGSGGVGKTRLAVAGAQAAAEGYGEGVVWVDLAAVGEGRLVAFALMQALGISDAGEDGPLQAVRAAIAQRELLLVLDNVEHVAADVSAVLAELLPTCPRLAILATSRARLDLPAEIAWTVPSLEVPDPERPPPLDELVKIPAVALFVASIRSAEPQFELDPDDAAAVAQVCAGLDGIPFALELAAARVRVMGVQTLAERLDRALGLLGESRSARPRHLTLRAALDFSHGLLDEREQRLLHRLSVFAGSFSLEAAEKVCSAPSLDEREIAEALQTLVDRSLVVGAAGRYRLLETTRQYAAERLDDEPALQRRHADYFAGLAEAADPKLRGPEQVMWHRRLAAEYPNLQAVLVRSRTAQGLEPEGIRVAAALGAWWYTTGRAADAWTWLGRAAESPPVDAVVHARAVMWLGSLAFDRGEYDVAKSSIERALAVLDEHDPWGAAVAVMLSAWTAAITGDVQAMTASFADARRRFDVLGDLWGQATIAGTEAELARMLGDTDGARAGAMAMLDRNRDLGDAILDAMAWRLLGKIELANGDADESLRWYGLALDATEPFGSVIGICVHLTGIGHAAALRGDGERAAMLLGAGEAWLARIGSKLQVHDAALHAPAVGLARDALGERAYAAAWERGRRLGLEEAVVLAHNVCAGPAATLLSARELEVAGLIAQGASNRQIAASLTISVHTAERHVENILSKLALGSRVQVATWFSERAG